MAAAPQAGRLEEQGEEWGREGLEPPSRKEQPWSPGFLEAAGSVSASKTQGWGGRLLAAPLEPTPAWLSEQDTSTSRH